MSVQAKFRVSQTTQFPPNGDQRTVLVKLNAVNGPEGTENASWSRYTPSGELSLTITNPEAAEQFLPGDEWFLTLSQVD